MLFIFLKFSSSLFLLKLGGLLFKTSGSNMQHATAYSFLLLVYAGYLNQANKKIDCGGGVIASSMRLQQLAKSQVCLHKI